MKLFNNTETQTKFKQWISNHPESYHSYDMNRFYDFVLSCKMNKEWITEEVLQSSFKEEKEWIDTYRNRISSEYFQKYLEIGNFIDFLVENKLITNSL